MKYTPKLVGYLYMSILIHNPKWVVWSIYFVFIFPFFIAFNDHYSLSISLFLCYCNMLQIWVECWKTILHFPQFQVT